MNNEEREGLISRAIDGACDAADWERLEMLAASDPAVWRDLGRSLRLDSGLRRALREVSARAERAPAARRRVLVRRFGPWAGWAAALVLGIAGGKAALDDGYWQNPPPAPRAAPSVAPEHLVTVGSQTLPAIDPKRFVGALPSLVVGFRPAAGSAGAEVIFLRRFLEAGSESELRWLVEDENGRPAAAPLGIAGLPFSESL